MGNRRSHKDEMMNTFDDQGAVTKFTTAQALLKNHLIHTRETLNGRDFLFLGPPEKLRDALKLIVDVEHASNQRVHIDYVQVDQYFLFRVVGSEAEQLAISSYFE